jgi:hypothetical protein
MAYLEHYGVGVDRRIRRLKLTVICAVGLIAAAGVALFFLHNYRQERQVKQFFALLSSHDYSAAYALWVAGESDRKGYPLQAFLEDWGPQSGRGNPRDYRIAKSRSCGTGVILTVDLDRSRRERLWVQRDSLVIGFPPPTELLPKICTY